MVPEFSLEYFDLFGLHHDLIAEYGLDAVRPCKSTPETCDSALFFDSVHPTARVHEIFGNLLADQILGISAQQNDFFCCTDSNTRAVYRSPYSRWGRRCSAYTSKAILDAIVACNRRSRFLWLDRYDSERLVREMHFTAYTFGSQRTIS